MNSIPRVYRRNSFPGVYPIDILIPIRLPLTLTVFYRCNMVVGCGTTLRDLRGDVCHLPGFGIQNDSRSEWLRFSWRCAASPVLRKPRDRLNSQDAREQSIDRSAAAAPSPTS